jgi:RimJ/RimL family protein N-acetyltransferase
MIIDELFRAEMNAAHQNFWLPNTKAYPDLYQWYTNWQVILKITNTIIGSIGFGGYPNDYGETSVGYMTDQQHWSQGYATEAVNTLAKWGFSFDILKAITADTPAQNLASQRVLAKADFKQTHTQNGLQYFKRLKI